MTQNKKGALPGQEIKQLIDAGLIRAPVEGLNPASLDLFVTDEIYQIVGVVLPQRGEKIKDLLKVVSTNKHDLKIPLAKDQAYIARLNITVPRKLRQCYGSFNPKSTTGRLDVHVRVLADGVGKYDTLPSGFRGSLWALIVPHSFPILLSENQALTQMRLFTHDTRLNELQLETAMRQHKLVWHEGGKCVSYSQLENSPGDGSVILSIDLDSEVVGWECIQPNIPLDLSKIGHYDPRDFFRPLEVRNDYLRLTRGSFTILSTAEFVRVPPCLACEMSPSVRRIGEFRAHYAGFIDPGWGYGEDGERRGRPLTLEVRAEEELIIRPGQPIAKIIFGHMSEVPETLYDAADSNYSRQRGPTLAKQFRIPR